MKNILLAIMLLLGYAWAQPGPAAYTWQVVNSNNFPNWPWPYQIGYLEETTDPMVPNLEPGLNTGDNAMKLGTIYDNSGNGDAYFVKTSLSDTITTNDLEITIWLKQTITDPYNHARFTPVVNKNNDRYIPTENSIQTMGDWKKVRFYDFTHNGSVPLGNVTVNSLTLSILGNYYTNEWLIAFIWVNGFLVEHFYNVTGIEPFSNDVPTDFSLSQNYPNPFNPTTSIKYSIGSKQNVLLRVFDLMAEEIETLVNKEKPAGVYTVEFDASKLSSGIYFYQLKAGDFTKTKKMILMR